MDKGEIRAVLEDPVLHTLFEHQNCAVWPTPRGTARPDFETRLPSNVEELAQRKGVDDTRGVKSD